MTQSHNGQSAQIDPPSKPSSQHVKQVANRLKQDANHKRARLSQYARWRTRIKGPSAADTFHAKQAIGTQSFCKNCHYFADSPQMVCALHPDGPDRDWCSDCIPQA